MCALSPISSFRGLCPAFLLTLLRSPTFTPALSLPSVYVAASLGNRFRPFTCTRMAHTSLAWLLGPSLSSLGFPRVASLGYLAGNFVTDEATRGFIGATVHTNSSAEMSAILWALLWVMQCPPLCGMSVEVHMDSTYDVRWRRRGLDDTGQGKPCPGAADPDPCGYCSTFRAWHVLARESTQRTSLE